MRTAIAVCLLVFSASLAAMPQKEAAPGPPKKGDAITVKGCLTGTALEATELGSTDQTGGLSSGLTFRLTGNKSLLKQLRDEHDGHLVEVEGVLKSELPHQNVSTRRVGKMRITIGSPAANPATPDAEARRAVPVLEVKSFDSAGTICRR
jgi:hypothetical protein